PSTDNYRPGERPKQIRHPDNLRPEGAFDRPSQQNYGPGERPKQIRHPDNLKSEGDFEKRVVQKVTTSERTVAYKPQDNLRMEGEFEKRDRTYTVRKVEQAIIRKHEDNLKVEGIMHFTNKNIHSDQKSLDSGYSQKMTENNQTVSDHKRINQVEKSHSSSNTENYSSMHKNQQNNTNTRKHIESQISLGDFPKDSNTKEKISVKYGQSQFEGELRQSAESQNIESRVVKQSSNSTFQKSSKSEEHVERKKWETSQKRDYLKGSVTDLSSTKNASLSKQQLNQTNDQRYSDNTTRQHSSNHYNHMSSQNVSSSNQWHGQTSEQHTYSSRQSQESRGQLNHDRLQNENHVDRVQNTQHRHGHLNSNDNQNYSAQQRNLQNIGQTSQKYTNETSGQNYRQSTITSNSKNSEQIRRPESFVISLSDEKSTNNRNASSIEQRSEHYSNNQTSKVLKTEVGRQSFASGNTNERNSTSRDYSSDLRSSKSAISNEQLNKSHRYETSSQNRNEYNRDHSKSLSSQQKSEQSTNRSHGNEVKSYSTATYRKSLHSTSSNVLNIDTSTIDRKTYSDQSHHRKSVISSNTDLSNSVLHRKGDVTHIEAPHTTSSAAAAQRRSINTLDSTFVVSPPDNRNSISAMHRQDRVSRSSTNRSHISLGDSSISESSTSHYRNEYKPRVSGPCPVPLIERNQAPFRHTRDTKTHKFYKSTTSDGDRR
ncbi:GATA zinc finger domain-containing protein 14-like, partial [Myzus persicae]|uniref:GATA zinc finger domain-containing protein 14-like n=1 Tax=Myzus persicae TaxID=13164 RepID=UPI000B935AD7